VALPFKVVSTAEVLYNKL